MLRSGVACLLVLFTVFSAAAILSAESDVSAQETGVIEGQVTEADWVGSTIVVRDTSDVRLSVPETAKVVKGDERASLEDVEVGDRVSARYYVNDLGAFVVKSMTIQDE